MNYAKTVFSSTQREPMFGVNNQVKNNAGGYVFEADSMDKVKRFLILGSEDGSYYVNESKLTKENAGHIIDVIKSSVKNAIEVVNMVVDVSINGKAFKNDPAIFVLALVATYGDTPARKYAYKKVNDVCRIATHLFTFLSYMKEMKGWGRGLRTAVSNWYTSKHPASLVNQLIKYKSRNGWTHKDAIALAHIKPTDYLMEYIFSTLFNTDNFLDKLMGDNSLFDSHIFNRYNVGMNISKFVGSDVKKTIDYIHKYKLPREVIPTEMLNEPSIWEAMINSESLGYTAIVRNLGKMSSVGYLTANSEASRIIQKVILDEEIIKNSRIHPINMLQGMLVYKNGAGFKGSNTWKPVQSVVGCMEEAFYKSFKYVEPSNKRHMLAIDISGSMSARINENSFLTSAMVSAVMAMAVARTERNYEIMGFSNKFIPLNINHNMSLEQVLGIVCKRTFGGTDCALPMLHAMKYKIPVDVFSVWTDNETWAGMEHPTKALKDYRNSMGLPDAKLAVCATTSNGFTIADPNDKNMLDIVGFDSSIPQLISEFAKGNV